MNQKNEVSLWSSIYYLLVEKDALTWNKKKTHKYPAKKIETRGHSFVVVKNQYVLLSQP
jgi:hypothetical protein